MPASKPLEGPKIAMWVLIGAVAFHLAFSAIEFSFCIGIYLGTLVQLTRIASKRKAFYAGLILGLLVFAPKLGFFYTLFSFAAAALWTILALWHGLFVYLGSWARNRFSEAIALMLIPIFWTGLEYFRSELYPLKFSWLAAGYAFSTQPNIMLSTLGLYGTGFAIILAAALITRLSPKPRWFASAAALVILFGLTKVPPPKRPGSGAAVNIAGMQLEFPVELEVPGKLDALKKKYPQADLFVLSEYTFDGPVPKLVAKWCRQNQKHLIVGAKDPAPDGNFYNTAFVIGTNGEVVFKQVKAVPIQFFKDGLPAPEQRPWDSPWGKIGVCICYDLSYTRVTDRLIRQGAQALIVPTMDVADWGLAQHQLHALIAPMRATEYGVPIFRLASSGISQVVNSTGAVETTAPFPGPEETMFGTIKLAEQGAPAIDRSFAPIFSVISFLGLFCSFFRKKAES
jgi:apolipoprotein N-acyltransferase